MKTLNAALQAHLDTRCTTLCHIWRLVRPDGFTLGVTDHDRPLDFDGLICEAEAGEQTSGLEYGADLSVDAQDVGGRLSSDRIDAGDIRAGLWDNAAIEIWRVNWQDLSQRVLLRKGHIGEIQHGEIAFMAEFRSLAHVLNQPVGRTCQFMCEAMVGDSNCRFDLTRSGFMGTGTTASVTTARDLIANGLNTFASGWFDGGVLTWTSGANTGRKFEVAAHSYDGSNVSLSLLDIPPDAMVAGDGFEVTAGCDKSRETCQAKFGNIINYFGFPDMPGDDIMIRAAKQGQNYAGGVL